MWRPRTLLLLGLAFLVASAAIYALHYAIFRDIHHIFIYMVGDLAFLPLEVFLVVIVLERLLSRREKQTIQQKLNMVVGAFFSEIGSELLRTLLPCFPEREELRRNLTVSQDWSRDDFEAARRYARQVPFRTDCRSINLGDLRELLLRRRPFLLRLLENPNLLEHDRFTDLLWATFHLAEELEARASLADLPETDLDHLSTDIERLYSLLVVEWIAYAEHLKESYPYLFSLMTRLHPFRESPSPVVG